MSETEAENSEVPLWDQAGLEKRVRGKHDRMVKLINLFLEDMPDRMEQLRIEITGQQLKEAKDTAHTIKGVSGNLGVSQLESIVAELEIAVSNQANDDIERLMPTVNETYTASHAILAQFVDDNPAP